MVNIHARRFVPAWNCPADRNALRYVSWTRSCASASFLVRRRAAAIQAVDQGERLLLERGGVHGGVWRLALTRHRESLGAYRVEPPGASEYSHQYRPERQTCAGLAGTPGPGAGDRTRTLQPRPTDANMVSDVSSPLPKSAR